MDPIQFKGQTRILGAPPGWDATKHGPCIGLPVRQAVEGNTPRVSSYWKPSAEDLAALNEGAHICLSIVGKTQPPVWLRVERADEIVAEAENMAPLPPPPPETPAAGMVHILRHGHPLCRFTEKLPSQWPAGHSWVGVEEIDSVTCQCCPEVAKQLNLRAVND